MLLYLWLWLLWENRQMDSSVSTPKAKHFQSNTKIGSCFLHQFFLFPLPLSSWFMAKRETLHRRKKVIFPHCEILLVSELWLDMATLCIKHASKPTVKSRLNSHLHGVNTKWYWEWRLFTTRKTESCRQCALGFHNTARTTSFRQQYSYAKPSNGSSTLY